MKNNSDVFNGFCIVNNNYSHATSLPAYEDNQGEKLSQLEGVISMVNNGSRSLKELANDSGLPQSTIAGRVNDAIRLGRLKYEGFVIFENRKRKKIVLASNDNRSETS